jgi:hypothetical protein
MKKLFWRAVNDEKSYDAQPVEAIGDNIEKIESEVFDKIKSLDFSPQKLYLRVADDDGSGCVCYYERRGEAWVRICGDNILPYWFPWFFFGIMGALIVVLYFICR